MSNQVLIQISNLSAAYNGKNVLHDINLTVYANDFLGIIGPNGGGKTTLLKHILGMMSPIAGQIQFFDHGREVPKISMGYLPQYNALDRRFPITVFDVVQSGLNGSKPIWAHFGPSHRDRTMQTIFRMGLESKANHPISALSGGELQRALLGRALVSEPSVLLLDEPNTYIDQRFETKLYTLLEEANKHCAIILVSHDIGSVLQNVRSIACVNHDLHYHPDNEITSEWIETHFGCPIELLGHGNMPHRVLMKHKST